MKQDGIFFNTLTLKKTFNIKIYTSISSTLKMLLVYMSIKLVKS